MATLAVFHLYCSMNKFYILTLTPTTYVCCLFRINIYRGHRGHDRMIVGFTTTYAISASITTDVVSSNLDQGEVYNIM